MHGKMSEGKPLFCKLAKKLEKGACVMVQWVKVLGAKPDSLSSVPRTNVVAGES